MRERKKEKKIKNKGEWRVESGVCGIWDDMNGNGMGYIGSGLGFFFWSFFSISISLSF